MKKFFQFFVDLPKRFVIILIELYQLLLSPDHSWLKFARPYGFCRFYPSCSEYSKQAITRFGLIYGSFLAIKRIFNCHPWAHPKVDSVPKTFSFWNKE